MSRSLVVAVLLCWISAWALSAQTSDADTITVRLPEVSKLPASPGFFSMDATVQIGQEQFPMTFGLFLPAGYFSSHSPFPVVMAIHNRGLEGVGARELLGCEGMARLWIEDGWDARDPATLPQPNSLTLRKSAKFIGIAPQCPREHPLEVAPMPQVLAEFVTQLGKVYRVDQDRVYLTGFSWGGTHTWMIAEQTPRRWAAIVPLSGKGTDDPAHTVASLIDVPIYLGCGSADPYFLQFCQQMNEALVAAGHPDFVYRVLPNGNHFSYCAVYTDPAFWDWLLAKQRKPHLATRPTTASTTRKP